MEHLSGVTVTPNGSYDNLPLEGVSTPLSNYTQSDLPSLDYQNPPNERCFLCDGIFSIGLNLTGSAGIVGGTLEFGLAIDFRHGFKYAGYATLEHALGADFLRWNTYIL